MLRSVHSFICLHFFFIFRRSAKPWKISGDLVTDIECSEIEFLSVGSVYADFI